MSRTIDTTKREMKHIDTTKHIGYKIIKLYNMRGHLVESRPLFMPIQNMAYYKLSQRLTDVALLLIFVGICGLLIF